jgi:membrane protein YdbS with pleckstrin-like domain
MNAKRRVGARIGRTLLHVGLIEWLVLLYLIVLAGMLVFTPAERGPASHLALVLVVLFVLVAAIVVYRKYFDGRPVIRF